MSRFHALNRMTFLIIGVISIANAFFDPNYVNDRRVMVHLFEWKWDDIADECERFLGPNGYAGVQVSPINENAIAPNRPWWERYQPISYKIATRSGDEIQFKSMVERCNKVGVRIYVDAVINHMTGMSNAVGTGGSVANGKKLEFPAVPYGPDDFNKPCGGYSYSNPVDVRNCELSGMPDLNQGRNDTRSKIIQFLNKCVSLGVAGFRIDAAKHMWPADLEIIYNTLNNLNVDAFPPNARPFIFQEVIDHGGEGVKKAEYTPLGLVTEFKYSKDVGHVFHGYKELKWLTSILTASDLLPSKNAFVFVDNHDNQRSKDGDILTYKNRSQYIMAVAFMLSFPYGLPRVMSSFDFTSFIQGPPANANEELISPVINPTTEQCENGWVCEHRWPEIRNMVKFRNTVGDAQLESWWDNGQNQIAYCRGNRGFIAFNNEFYDLNMTLRTCLPEGVYCDVITGNILNGKCTGTQVVVDANGQGHVHLPSAPAVLAIHIGAKL